MIHSQGSCFKHLIPFKASAIGLKRSVSFLAHLSYNFVTLNDGIYKYLPKNSVFLYSSVIFGVE